MPRKLIITASSPSGGGGISLENIIALSTQTVAEELGPNVVIANIVMPPNSGTWSFEVPADKNAGGRVQVVGATLRTTSVKFDFEGIKQYTIRVIATRLAPTYIQVERDFVLNVSNVAGDTMPVELDFVNESFVGAAKADLTVVAPARTVRDNLGNNVNIGANAIADTDIGVWVNGKSASYYVGRALRPDDANGWTLVGEAWATKSIDPVPALATTKYPYPARLSQNNAFEGRIRPPVLANPPNGSAAVVHVAVFFDDADPNAGNTASLRMSWNAGANTETWNLQFLDPTSANELALVNAESGYTPNGVISQPIWAVRGADGWTEVAFAVNAVPAADFMLDWIRNDQDANTLVIGYANVYGGTERLPLRDTGAGPGAEVVQADDHTLNGPLAAILQGVQGTFIMEVQGISYDTMGVVGMGAASVAGNLLRVGAANLLKPSGPTAVQGPDGTTRALGISGWRGITIVGMAWDATGVSVYANGGKILSSAGIAPAGAVKLLQGISGRIRKLSGSTVKIGNPQLRELTMLWNKEFVRPGSAFAPGICNITHWNDYDGADLNCALRRQSNRAPEPVPGQPWYPEGSVMAQSYDLTQQLTGEVDFGSAIFIPRYHFHNWSRNGQGNSGQVAQINGEPQFFTDPVGSGVEGEAIVNHEVANSTFRFRIRLTSSLTPAQQAVVPNDPQTGAKMKYVGAAASTYQHFTQRYGVFSSRDKMPAFKGGWPAWWLYWVDGQEIDIEEFWGINPTLKTFTLHEPDINVHEDVNHNLGFNGGDDFHDRTLVWRQGTLVKYLNGEQVGQHNQTAAFDADPMYLLYDFAIYPAHVDASTDAYLEANPNAAIEVDRTTVMQFAA